MRVPERLALFLLLFALRCRRRRRRDLVQLPARVLERAGERGGRRVAGKPRRTLAGEAGEPLAERGYVCLRTRALDFGAQRLGERGGGTEFAQRLHIGVHALVRRYGEVDHFLLHRALGTQLGERLVQIAQLPGGEGARLGRRLDQAAETRGKLRRQRSARQVAPAHAQQVVAVPVDAVVAVLGRFRDALEERRVGDALHGSEAYLPELGVARDIRERRLVVERLQHREALLSVRRRADRLGAAHYDARACRFACHTSVFFMKYSRQTKKPDLFRDRAFSLLIGVAVTYFRVRDCTLSSAQTRFTVLFGMGRRGSRLLWPPHRRLKK